MSSEGVDHGGDTGSLTTTSEIEIEHALNGTGLKTVNERTGILVERTEPGTLAWGSKVVEMNDSVLSARLSGSRGISGREFFPNKDGRSGDGSERRSNGGRGFESGGSFRDA